MPYAKEYSSRYGTFYSGWAFDDDADYKVMQNESVLRKLDGKYIKAYGNEQDIESVCAENPDKMVYVYGTQTCGKVGFRIVQNPSQLSVAELALIVDNGSLCFGFSGNQSYIDIYTD